MRKLRVNGFPPSRLHFIFGFVTLYTTIPESEQADIIRAVPEAWTRSFGVPFYLRERSIHELENQSEQDWKLYIEGQLFSTGRPLNMTSYEELRQYIRQELSAAPVKEG